MSVRSGRAWDGFDGYLFDIDGTLMECTDATHYFAFCQVLTGVAGRALTLEGVTAHGNTDVGILRDAFELAGVEERVWREHLPGMREEMGNFVEARKDELCTRVLPEVKRTLEHLRARGAKLAVATGNLERIGRMKLEHAGLMDLFDFGGWSDLHEYRRDVFRAAVEEAHRRWGSDAALCVVGDTPVDVSAAHENGLPVIAVATGVYTVEQLRAGEPEWCVGSLAELMGEG